MPKRQKKQRIPRPPQVNQFVAQDVFGVLDNAPTPVSWRDLSRACGASDPRGITQLRQLLRGLERNGEIKRNPKGDYVSVRFGSQDTQTEKVVQRGKRLFVDGVELSAPGHLRDGDEIKVVWQSGEPHVLDVVSFSSKPVVGIVRALGRVPYVQGLGEFRGRVTLPELPAGVEDGDTVNVRVEGRDRRGLVGVVVNLIGGESVLDTAINAAITSSELPHEWPEAVSTQVGKLPRRVYPGRFPQRRDLTALPLVTIDGETAKDFDDE